MPDAAATSRTSAGLGWLRDILLQTLAFGVIAAIALYLVHNTFANLERQGIATGFGYLGREASFGIGETLIPYSPSDSFGRALLVGILNTLEVCVLAIILSTVLGLVIGIARLSRNFLAAKLSILYIEVLRNIPLLLQLILWWDVTRVSAPAPRDAWELLPGFFLSNRGLTYPTFSFTHGLDWPVLQGFNFVGGGILSPEFAALLLGLSFYTAAFVAEIVRSGIEGVRKGQSEAALALGLSRAQMLRLVILPQSLKIIVPPLIGEYQAMIKNTSLAIAIGFPELMSVTNTTLNITGQAIEAIALMMGVYLGISLLTALLLNIYNARLLRRERR